MSDRQCKCDNCAWSGPESKLGRDLENTPDLDMRLDPGGVVPAGECPKCGALAYLVDIAKLQAETDAKNAATSAAEVSAFKLGAAHDGKPYVAYLARDKETRTYIVTTWTGDILAHVTRINIGPAPRSWWISDTRGSLWARGIDGRMYHARHCGEGIALRLRLSKVSK